MKNIKDVQKNVPMDIQYTDSKGSVTSRTHIFLKSGHELNKVSTLDVSSLTPDELADLVDTMSDYEEYLKTLKPMSLEDFYHQTKGVAPPAHLVKFRSLKIEKIELKSEV